MKLTPRMRQVLEGADLERGTVSDVPTSTWHGLMNRGLVTRDMSLYGRTRDSFPLYSGVKLTEAGIRAACGLQHSAADGAWPPNPRTVDV